jgi:hypothetical protein
VASRLCGLVANPAFALSCYADKLHERLNGLYAPSRLSQKKKLNTMAKKENGI